ncbi:MAG: hypothetical protein ACREMF_02815, partial [Gemmatimonadales bacterium]
ARLISLVALVYTAGTATACTAGAVPRRAQASSVQVDSAIPRDEELRRFRLGLADPTELVSGAPSRDALVERYVRALEGNDTAALAGLAITQDEFAYLYYPTTPLALPPYDLSPGLMWFQLQQRSLAGMRHALDERGGRPLGYLGYSCDGASSREGLNTTWGPCLIRRRQPGGDVVRERLFGLIIGRGGRYKLVSLANRL